MRSTICLAILSITFISVRAQLNYGHAGGFYGAYGTYGPFTTNVNPVLENISQSFFARILRKLDHSFITANQREQVVDILKDTERNFRRCEDEFGTYPFMSQYKSCLAAHVNYAMEQIRSLEMINRPYSYGGYGYGGYGYGGYGYGKGIYGYGSAYAWPTVGNSIKSTSKDSDE